MTDRLYDNVILTDADGCILYWEHGFCMWMRENDYGTPKCPDQYDLGLRYDLPIEQITFLAKMFNESANLSRLPPMHDAIKYVKKLHEEHGYVFHCITAIPNIEASLVARWENIRNLFGNTAFEKLILCGSSKAKDTILQQYKDSGCYWIEDLPENSEYGLKYGLKPLLYSQPYNGDYHHPSIPRVGSWKEIYDIITLS